MSTRLFEAGFDIRDSQQFDDTQSGQFYVRIEFSRDATCDAEGIRTLMRPVVDRFGMQITVHDQAVRRRVMLLASRFDHCLTELIYRQHSGDLPMEVVGVLSAAVKYHLEDRVFLSGSRTIVFPE